jgi:hypothetical protein
MFLNKYRSFWSYFMARTEDLMSKPATFKVVASGINSSLSAEQDANPDQTIYITGVSISASGAPDQAVTAYIYDGTTVIDQFEIPAAAFSPIVPNYGRAPLRCTPGENAKVTLPALGVSVTGTVVLKGFVLT